MPEQDESLRSEIVALRDLHLRLQNRCFWTSEWLKLVAVVTALLATVLIGILGGESGAPWIALLSAVSAGAIAAERSFPFKSRSGWHCDYRMAAEELLVQFDAGGRPLAVREAMLRVDRAMHGRFPHGEMPGAN